MLAAASGYFAFCKYGQKSLIPQTEKAGNDSKEDKDVKSLGAKKGIIKRSLKVVKELLKQNLEKVIEKKELES